MKKLVILLLALCLLPLAGLAEGEAWRADLSNMPISQEKTELDVFAVVTSDVEDMNTNRFTQYYEDLTNIHVNWTTANTSDSATQLNLSLASGEYPDIYLCTLSTDQVVSYAAEGVFLPLEDLIEEHAPNIRAIFETWPELKDMITAPDGHIYTLFRKDDMSNQFPMQKLWVFLPWQAQYQEATGKGEPETLADLRAMWEYFRDNDMNGNGNAADEIPLMGTYAWAYQGSDPLYYIMNCFTYFPDNIVYGDGEKCYWAATGDDFREGLKYVRGLVADGLLSELTYTQDLNQYRAVVNVTTPEDMVVGTAAAPYHMRFVTSSIYTRALEDFFVLPRVKGETGLQVSPSKSTGLMPNWAITSACEDPVAAIKWLDALASREMALINNYGVEGEDWVATGEYDEVKGPTIQRYTNSLIPEGSSTQNNYWPGWMARLYEPGKYMLRDLLAAEGTVNYYMNKASEIYRQYAVDDGTPSVVWCSDEDLSLEVSELSTVVTDYTKNMYTQFILGLLDINDDAQWEAYEQGLKDQGLERYLEAQAEYWYGEN